MVEKRGEPAVSQNFSGRFEFPLGYGREVLVESKFWGGEGASRESGERSL